jgi:uncharacterized protein YacL (UPF0231 family)
MSKAENFKTEVLLNEMKLKQAKEMEQPLNELSRSKLKKGSKFSDEGNNWEIIERDQNLAFCKLTRAGDFYTVAEIYRNKNGDEAIKDLFWSWEPQERSSRAHIKKLYDVAVIDRDKTKAANVRDAEALKQYNERVRLNGLKIYECKQLIKDLTEELRQFAQEAKTVKELLKNQEVVKICNALSNIQVILLWGGIQ